MIDTSIPAPGAEAIAKAHAIYTPFMLRIYDQLVHGFSNRFAWHCPTDDLIGLYRENLSANHLEAGVGTGFFIERAAPPQFQSLTLMDLNPHCLALSGRRLARYRPALRQGNLLAPLDLDIAPVESLGLTYVLHCLPGRMTEKLEVIDHLKPSMRKGAVLFGATILGRGIAPNAIARTLMRVYNSKGVFNNMEDDVDALASGLEARFANVEIERQGCVARFRAL